MTLRTLLNALRACGDRGCKTTWDNHGNIIANKSLEERNERLADKIQTRIEKMFRELDNKEEWNPASDYC